MIKGGGFLDSYARLHPRDPGLTWNQQNPYTHHPKMPDRRLDYIFYRNASSLLSKLASVELVYTEPNEKGVYASDHYGVLATFE